MKLGESTALLALAKLRVRLFLWALVRWPDAPSVRVGRLIASAVAASMAVLASGQARSAETVYVKYRGPVNLAPFDCRWIHRSSFVQRLCYDRREQYVIVQLSGVYYHYCEVPAQLVIAWQSAESLGRFYNTQVKGRYDCRTRRVPAYR